MADVSPFAGKRPAAKDLIDVARIVAAYFSIHPDPDNPANRVSFGTSGHRGSSLDGAFNEDHILAIVQAVCDWRKANDIAGPLFLGFDTHALSEPAFASALEVLAANGVETMIDRDRGYTPTPVISHAILNFNRGKSRAVADGIVITPSHNPPADGGIKYNPPSGGAADTAITGAIEKAANDILRGRLRAVRRMPVERALAASTTHRHDFMTEYVDDLGSAVDMAVIRGSRVRIGIDPLGGAAVRYWQVVIDRFRIDATVVSEAVDPTFGFMTADWDGKIRMDCSSPYAMQRLIEMRNQFDVAFGNDTDVDRHGIVTPAGGLMNPNHYIAVAIDYLFKRRTGWSANAAVGKTVVSSSIIDRVTESAGRRLIEVPVGFKWFTHGLLDGSIGFAGEESAGATFLRRDGTAWTTDKDGIILGLLAAEITAQIEIDLAEAYRRLTDRFGAPVYERIDAPASSAQKDVLKNLTGERIGATELAGEPITSSISHAPGNNQAIGGVKVAARSGWFAARPSGTENVYKIYAESFIGEDHLRRIQDDARAIVARAFAVAGV